MLHFPDAVWDESKVGYIFFRNAMPNVSALVENTLYSPSSSAYCCQCSWLSVAAEDCSSPLLLDSLSVAAGDRGKSLIKVKSIHQRVQWVCSGHT